MSNTKQFLIGQYKNLNINIVTWDGVTAEVDLSCGCLFDHEVDHAPVQGGLADLNQTLNGKLLQIREEKLFTAVRFETLLFDQAQPNIQSEKLLLIGMGNPEDWSTADTAKAVQVAFRTAQQLGVKSVAFAPSILDTGLKVKVDLSSVLVQALLEVYEAHLELENLGLVSPCTVQTWYFDAGDHQFEEKANNYIQIFKQLTAQ